MQWSPRNRTDNEDEDDDDDDKNSDDEDVDARRSRTNVDECDDIDVGGVDVGQSHIHPLTHYDITRMIALTRGRTDHFRNIWASCYSSTVLYSGLLFQPRSAIPAVSELVSSCDHEL